MMPTCPVCLDEKELIPLETCSHGICSTCIVKTLSFRDNCPVCRTVWCPDMMSSGMQNAHQNESNSPAGAGVSIGDGVQLHAYGCVFRAARLFWSAEGEDEHRDTGQ